MESALDILELVRMKAQIKMILYLLLSKKQRILIRHHKFFWLKQGESSSSD